ncbi:MAG: site-specific integrase [Aquificae bacterium]|nr:site-specific integrase [Aquificota bacterium]
MSLRLENIPSWEEVKEIWSRAERERADGRLPLRDYLLLGFVLFTGCRISEILGLRKEDINLKRGVAVIRQLKKREEVKREVLVPGFLMEPLEEYLKGVKSGERIFPMGRSTAYTKVKEFTGYHPHAFRHTFAIRLLSKTGNMEYVRRLLGHSNYNTLKHYLNFTVEDIKEELKKALE